MTDQGDTTHSADDLRALPEVPDADLADGTCVGRYTITRRLGAGGMGVVYAAWDAELSREVALKVVRPRADVTLSQARARREARAMARISHPNIVPVFDVFEHGGQIVIAMERVTGDSLRTWVPARRPWRAVLAVFVSVGRALAAAHAVGLIHRDIKPDNIIVGADGAPRITDFGLARTLQAEPAEPARHAGALQTITTVGAAGTPAYMAPELFQGAPYDDLSEQFAFCVSLFEVLYGARPADAPGRRRGPRWLDAVLRRGLAAEPARRWPSMSALLVALRRRQRRHRAIQAGLAANAVAVVAWLLVHRATAPLDCRTAMRDGNDASITVVCGGEYARSHDPRAGLAFAEALRRTGKLDDARTIARALQVTPLAADAVTVLGRAALDDGAFDDAERLLAHASALHRARGDDAGSASALLALARALPDRVERLVVLAQAIDDARRAGVLEVERKCHLAAARTLSELGAAAGARAELASAEALIATLNHRALHHLERGNVDQNLGDHAAATREFDIARAIAAGLGDLRLVRYAYLNAAYSMAAAGHAELAARELAAATALELARPDPSEQLSIAARIAAVRGELGRADELAAAAQAATAASDHELRLEYAVQRAEIALHRADHVAAEAHARAALAELAVLRPKRPDGALRAWLVTDWRAPHELLVASLAAQGRTRDALVALDGYLGLAVLARRVTFDARGVRAPATAALSERLRTLSQDPLAAPAAVEAIDAARTRTSMLAVFVAAGEIWQLATGEARGARLAAFTEHGAADALARLVDAVPARNRLLFVIDERVSPRPLAALAADIVARAQWRAVTIVARPSQLACDGIDCSSTP